MSTHSDGDQSTYIVMEKHVHFVSVVNNSQCKSPKLALTTVWAIVGLFASCTNFTLLPSLHELANKVRRLWYFISLTLHKFYTQNIPLEQQTIVCLIDLVFLLFSSIVWLLLYITNTFHSLFVLYFRWENSFNHRFL